MILIPFLLGILLGCGGLALAVVLPQRILDADELWVQMARGETAAEARAPLWRRLVLAIRANRTVAAGFVGLAVVWSYGLLGLGAPDLRHAALLVLSVGLMALGLADAQTRLLPDSLTFSLLWLGMLVQINPATQIIDLEQAVLGAALAYLVPWLIGQAFIVLGREQAIGQGDLKLLATLGAWFGMLTAFKVIFFSSLMIIVWHITLICRFKNDQSEYPFGPWICSFSLLVISLRYMARYEGL